MLIRRKYIGFRQNQVYTVNFCQSARKLQSGEKISAFGKIRYMLLISARALGNYNALTNHMWALKDIANLAKKYRLLAKSDIYS